MKCPTRRSKKFAITASALFILTISVFAVRFPFSIAEAVGRFSANIITPKPVISSPFQKKESEQKTSGKQNLLPLTGRLMFDTGNNQIRAIDNVGTSNDLSDVVFNSSRGPKFSPDGSKVIFVTGRHSDNGYGTSDLYIMDPDGYNQRRLSFDIFIGEEYSFSANGQKIVFTANINVNGRPEPNVKKTTKDIKQGGYSSGVFIINTDGTGLIQFPDPANEGIYSPSLSPDGSKVTFGRNGGIWVANIDGTQTNAISPTGNYPFFSPDGQKVFWQDGFDVHRANIDGSGNEIVLSGNGGPYSNWYRAQLSPDANRLLFLCDGYNGTKICVGSLNGTNSITEIDIAGLDSNVEPVWSPEGDRVALVRNDGVNSKLTIADISANISTDIYTYAPYEFPHMLAWQPKCTVNIGNTNGLVSYWSADDSAADSFGTNNGIFALPAYGEGKFGRAFSFDGTGNDNFVEFPDSDSLDVQAGDYTLSVWAKFVEGNREHYIAGKGACGGTGSNFYIGINENNQAFIDISHEGGGSRVSSSAGILNINTWHHLVLRKIGPDFTLFKDGNPVLLHTETGQILVNEAPFTIGKGDGCNLPELVMHGLVDDVRLFNRSLSDPEIAELYNYSPDNNGGNCSPVAESPLKLNIFSNPIAQGRSGQAEVRLSGFAPAGGLTINLQSSDTSRLSVPSTVTIPEFSNQAAFPFSTLITNPNEFLSADITATDGNDTARATLAISPASPDIAAGNLQAPATVNVFENLNVTVTISNNGEAATGNYREDQIWISPDNQLFNGPEDVRLAWHYDYSAVLNPGQSKTFTTGNFQIPRSAIPVDGTYYLFYWAGSQGVNERGGNWADNFVYVPINVSRNLPDLIAANLSGPSEIEPNVTFTINWDVVNQGSASTINGFQHNAYLSFDQTVGNSDDIPITFRGSGPLAPGQSASFSQQFFVQTLPVRPSSDALIYIRVDTSNQVDEGSSGEPGETNNITTLPVRFEYRVPDLQVTALNPPAEVDSDTNFALQWTTTNAGLRSAGPMNERVYFSTDNQVGGDVLLGTFPLDQSLQPGESISRIQNVSIPTNAISSSGNYFVYVKTDDFGQIDEGANENNNIFFSPVSVRRILRPDLQITNITAPPTAFFGQQIQVQWTVTNNGAGPTNSPGWRDQVLIGPNPNLNGATFLADSANVSYLAVGESYAATANVQIPRGFTGTYYFIIRTDVNNSVNEENENNNTSTQAVIINIPPIPDLRASVVQAPDTGFAGAPISVSWTVTNNGDGAVPLTETTWYDAVYISRDTTLDGNDQVLGYRTHTGSLAPGASYTVTDFSVNLPANTIGDYYVFVVTDTFGAVYEYTNENNNFDYDRIEPGSPMTVNAAPPDLRISSSISSPDTAVSGSVISTSFTVNNQGAFDANGTWRETIWLSADATFDPQTDTLLGSVPRTNLGAGQSYTAAINASIPTCISGTFYLFAVTDYYNNIFEFDPNFNAEANNVSAPRQISITNSAPDLIVSAINVPPTVINGSMPVSWTVRNQGLGATVQTSWADRIYLMNGSQLITLGVFQRQGALAVNAEYSRNEVVQVPLYLQGEFAIVVQTDVYNSVPECSFEQNNENSSPTTLQSDLPDLRINSVTAPVTATVGSTINVQWTGQNAGSAKPSGVWADRVYLSDNATFEPYDRLIGGAVFSQALAANETYSGNANVTLPNVLPGSYYLITVADATGQISEGAAENNNATAVAITLTTPSVDLQVTSINAASPINSGQFVNVSWTVSNTGSQATATGNWTDTVVLSRDSILDPSDVILGYRPHSGVLSGGDSYSQSDNFWIPQGLTGDYRIMVITDRGNEVVENNDANNLSWVNVTLQLPPPAELNITSISPPVSITLGTLTHFGWTVQNSSSNEASGIWSDSVYLSTDAIWDSGDVFIGSVEKSGTVAGFATYTASMDLVIPPVDPGSYYVIVRTDARNNIRESNETNNIAAAPAPVPVTVQNLDLGVPFSTTLVTGQERFFRIGNTPADETMLITLSGEAGSQNQLFSRYGAMVSLSNYQFIGSRPGEPDQENVIPNTASGDYFSMIRGDYVPGSLTGQLRKDNKNTVKSDNLSPQNVTVKAEILPLSIRRVSPSSGGNSGWLSLQIDGAKFAENAVVKLVGAGNHVITATQSSASPARIAALFELKGEPAGFYDVVVTNPNNQSATLAGGFEILNGGGHQLRAAIAPRPGFRGGTQRFTFSAHNDGLNDAMNVPVFIQIPAGYDYRIDQRNYIAFPTDELPPDAVPEQIPQYIDIEGVRTILLYAPLVRSRSSVTFSIDVDVPLNYGEMPVAIQILPPLGELAPYLGNTKSPLPAELVSFAMSSPANPPVDPNCWAELFRQIFFAAINEILPSDCLQAGWTVLMSSADFVSGLLLKGASISGWDAVSSLSSKFVSTAGKLAECAGVAIPWLRVVSIIVNLVQILNQLDDCLGGNFKQRVVFRRPFSLDPNEKLGPEGYGPEHFIGINQPIEYRINFENVATAGAPAQIIKIVDQLPPELDPRTLRLREIGFKQYRIIVPENRSFFQTKLQLGEDLGNIKADISAGINILNNTVTWTLTAIDPQTNDRPSDPLVGILPPNNSNRDGEGYVTFTVMPAATQPTRTLISNRATIYFDENEPIVTNATSNLLDADIPVSSVTALPATTANPVFTISWTSADAPDGSGLKSVDVYVSEDGGDYRPLSTAGATDSITFIGNWGHNYRFYSVAIDNSGNVEPPPSTPDAEITVLGGAFEADTAPRPNGDNDGTVSVADLTQIRRFVSGLDTDLQYNEFQRADTSPLESFGDGVLSVADVLQTRRYAAGLDAVRFAGGPNTASLTSVSSAIEGKRTSLAGREIHPVRVARVGNQVTLAVIMDAQGDEVGIGFTLNYDPAVISNPSNITPGAGASGMTLTYNANTQGRIGIVLDKDPLQPLPAGPAELVRITFTVAPSNPSTAQINFGNVPVRREVVNGLAQPLAVTFTDSVVSLVGPTAAPASVAGRVITTSGSGLSNIQITVTDADTGQTRTVKTNSFGNYRFEGLAAGRTYIVTAANRKYVFEPESRIVMLTQDIADVDFRVSN